MCPHICCSKQSPESSNVPVDVNRKFSLRKSSSDGLLKNLFRKSSQTKTSKSKLVQKSDEGTSILSDEKREQTNKAFRSETGPLILVPQPLQDIKGKKPLQNIGIHQISSQQASQIFKDHKKLKESLFTDEQPTAKITKHKGKQVVSKQDSKSEKVCQESQESQQKTNKTPPIIRSESVQEKEVTKEPIGEQVKQKKRYSIFNHVVTDNDNRKEEHNVKHQSKSPTANTVKKKESIDNIQPSKLPEEKISSNIVPSGKQLISSPEQSQIKPIKKSHITTDSLSSEKVSLKNDINVLSFPNKVHKKVTNKEDFNGISKTQPRLPAVSNRIPPSIDQSESEDKGVEIQSDSHEKRKPHSSFVLNATHKKDSVDKVTNYKVTNKEDFNEISKNQPRLAPVSNKIPPSVGLSESEDKRVEIQSESHEKGKPRSSFFLNTTLRKDSVGRVEENTIDKTKPCINLDGSDSLAHTGKVSKRNVAVSTVVKKNENKSHTGSFALERSKSTEEAIPKLKPGQDEATLPTKLVYNKEQKDCQFHIFKSGGKENLIKPTKEATIKIEHQSQIIQDHSKEGKDLKKEKETISLSAFESQNNPKRNSTENKGKFPFSLSSVIPKKDLTNEIESHTPKSLLPFSLTKSIKSSFVNEALVNETKSAKKSREGKPPIVPKLSFPINSKSVNKSKEETVKPLEPHAKKSVNKSKEETEKPLEPHVTKSVDEKISKDLLNNNIKDSIPVTNTNLFNKIDSENKRFHTLTDISISRNPSGTNILSNTDKKEVNSKLNYTQVPKNAIDTKSVLSTNSPHTENKSFPLEEFSPPNAIRPFETSLNSNNKNEVTDQNALNANDPFHQQKNIREIQERKILELHLKHTKEIDKLRHQNVSVETSSFSKTSVEVEILSSDSLTSTEPSPNENKTDKKINQKNTHISLESNKAEHSHSYDANNSTDINVNKNAIPITKSNSDNPTQKFSFSNYLTRSRKDSVEEKDKISQPKLEEPKVIKADIPKKVHFPDEVKDTIAKQSLVDEKLSRASITNDSQSSDLVDKEIAQLSKEPTKFTQLKQNTVSILKKSSDCKDTNRNETSVSCPIDTSLTNNCSPVLSNVTNDTNVIINVSTSTPVTKLTRASTFVIETNHNTPSRPPRKDKQQDRKRSSSVSDAMRHQMSDKKVSKEEMPRDANQHRKIQQNTTVQSTVNNPAQNEQPKMHQRQDQDKKVRVENKKEQIHDTNEQKKHSEKHRNSKEEQGMPYSPHDKQKTTRDSQHDKNKQEKREEKQTQETSLPKTPQPPTRTNKPRTKAEVGHKGPAANEDQFEGILVTACKVAEEDQIMRLLRDLSKTSRFESELINQIDKSGRGPLSHACSNGFASVVEFLTSQPDIDLNLIDNDGNTPLHYAAQGGHVEIVSHLVNGCSRQVDLDVRNNLGFTPLMKAALQGRTKIAKVLLFAGASPHLRDFGRGLCAQEWAKYTGRDNCGDLIESVQRSCSSHIREKWTSDPDFKLSQSSSSSSLSSYQNTPSASQDNKDSWLKHKIKKAFNKSESKKEFSVASNLSTLAQCVSSPLLPCQPVSTEPQVPKVQVTEVSAPDCYFDPDHSEGEAPQSSEECGSEDDLYHEGESTRTEGPTGSSKPRVNAV